MLEKYIEAALKKADSDVVLKHANIVNVFSGTITKGDVAIKGDRIVGIGEDYKGAAEYDCSNKYVLPGLIDGHVHIESSMLTPEGFASLVMPHGTTTIVADPHEIVNVAGLDGLHYMIEAGKRVPLDIKMQLPSCVPATPFETSGAIVDGTSTEEEIKNPDVNGLGEFMNFAGVLSCDPDALKKLEAAHANNKIVDGHAPMITGDALNGYLCGGIVNDHESSTIEEMQEKIAKGMYAHLRVGSYTKSLELAKAITPENSRRVLMCTDDRHASDIYYNGHLDNALRKTVEAGIDPITAVRMATLNCAECYGMKWRGGIAPFYYADIVVVDDLKNFNAELVFKDGKLVAKGGKALFDVSVKYLPDAVLNTVHMKDVTADDFKITLKGTKANVMTTEATGVMTGLEVMDIKSKDGDVCLEGTNLAKLICVERHHMTGNIGKGLIKDYGFKGGAIGISVGHDSHNLTLIGDDNECLAKAANTLKEIGGGMVLVSKEEGKTYSVPLEIGGLMSAVDPMRMVVESKKLADKAYEMGVDRMKEPFFSMEFLSLAVIPHIRLVDRGLVDVLKWSFIPLDAE